MEKNFRIIDSVGLESDDFFYDIHNDYDFVGFYVALEGKGEISFRFRKKERDWVNKSNPGELLMGFKGITYFQADKKYFFQKPFGNVEELGFKDVQDFDLDWLIQDEQLEKGSDSHFIFRMDNGSYFRIGCESITVEPA